MNMHWNFVDFSVYLSKLLLHPHQTRHDFILVCRHYTALYELHWRWD